MRLPALWHRRQEEIAAVARQAAEAAAERTAEQMRAMIAVSPMPGGPISPADNAPSVSPEPLYAYNYPWQFFTPQAPTKRPRSLVSVEDLRLFADRYDVLRACIQHLKREVSAVPLQIVPRDAKLDTEAAKARVDQAQQFFSTRGGLGGFGRLRSEFEGMVIEDLCVVGQSAIYYSQTRGELPYEALVIDAATIRPRVDAFGWPGPGEKVFEQWVLGLKVGDGFTREEMSFTGLPTHARSYTPYFASPVEWLLTTILAALKADEWNRTWLTDGTTPDQMIALPEGWSPAQVREWSEWWDKLNSGRSQERHKLKWVPSGSQRVGTDSRKDQDFQEFELWLLRRTCAVMGVQPASVGFAGEQYKVSQEDSMESTSSFGVGVILDYRKTLYDDMLERLGFPELEATNVTAREEKATERATRNTQLLAGVKTPNEARQEEGLDPIEGGDTLFVPNTLVPIEQALEPPEPASAPGAPPSDDANTGGDQSARAALRQWERKALNRLRAGKGAACEFGTQAIELPQRQRISGLLAGCKTGADVRALFRAESAATTAGDEDTE